MEGNDALIAITAQTIGKDKAQAIRQSEALYAFLEEIRADSAPQAAQSGRALRENLKGPVLTLFLSIILDTILKLKQNVPPQLGLESMFVRMQEAYNAENRGRTL